MRTIRDEMIDRKLSNLARVIRYSADEKARLFVLRAALADACKQGYLAGEPSVPARNVYSGEEG